MQLLTADGSTQSVRPRSFPMTGIDMQQMRSQSSQAIPLGRLPSGETRMLAISRVYRTNPVVYACVHLIARGLSTIPLRTLTVNANGERSRIRSDVPQPVGRPSSAVALDRLARFPAPKVSKRKLVFRTVLDAAVYGNALASFNWGDYGPSELWPIPWRRTVAHLIDPLTITEFDVWGTLGKRILDPDHVIHWTWGDDPETPLGVSPIESLQYTIALHNAIDRHLISYYGNAARPSGLLKLERMPDDKQLEGLREQFKQLYTAPESAGNVIITSGEWSQIAEATGVPTLVELVKLSRQEIMSVYGVDPPMIGIYDNAIRSNFQEGREKHVLDTLGPWAELWTSEANSQMIQQNPLWANDFWEFDLQERLRPDLAKLAAIMVQLSSTWTTNERRVYMNLPRLPYPEADTVFPGSGTYPLGMGQPSTIVGPEVDEPDPLETGVVKPAGQLGTGETDDDDEEDDEPEISPPD